jgi:hypothetical protein
MDIFDMAIAKKMSSGSSSSGGRMDTCTMRFVDGGGIQFYFCHYTKYENGVLSTVTIGSDYDEPQTGFNIVLENVLCGSIVYCYRTVEDFGMGDFNVDGSATVQTLPDIPAATISESAVFIAPSEAGCDCTVTLLKFGEGDWWG